MGVHIKSRIGISVFLAALALGVGASAASAGVSSLLPQGEKAAPPVRESQNGIGPNFTAGRNAVPPAALPGAGEGGVAPENSGGVSPEENSGSGGNGAANPEQVRAVSSGSRSLPFTGLMVLAVAGTGGALLAAGFVLRRRQVLA
jgi:hypothetical protein